MHAITCVLQDVSSFWQGRAKARFSSSATDLQRDAFLCKKNYHTRTGFIVTVRRGTWQGIGDGAFVGQNRLFPFCTVVFTSWDFHLTDASAAKALRHSIRTQLKEMVGDAEREEVVQTKQALIISHARKVGICLSFTQSSKRALCSMYAYHDIHIVHCRFSSG